MNWIPCVLMMAGLALAGSQAGAQQKTPDLPEMPALSREAPTIDTGNPALPKSTPMPPTAVPPSRQMPTAEQLEQLKKEKNWLVEGLKERQAAEASSNRPPEDMSQSIIDMVLQKQQSGTSAAPHRPDVSPSRTQRTPTTPGVDSTRFRPAISTSAFEPLPGTQESTLTSPAMESILARERALVGQDTFPSSANTSPTTTPLPARDPLANPFANLPIPEGVLPAAPRNRDVYTVNDPMLPKNPWADLEPSAPPLNANPALPAPSGGLAMDASSPPPAVRATAEQPYDYLRAQELQRQQDLRNNNRPNVRQLRSPVPDPSEARLF